MRWKIITEIKTSMYMNYIINKSKKQKKKQQRLKKRKMQWIFTRMRENWKRRLVATRCEGKKMRWWIGKVSLAVMIEKRGSRQIPKIAFFNKKTANEAELFSFSHLLCFVSSLFFFFFRWSWLGNRASRFLVGADVYGVYWRALLFHDSLNDITIEGPLRLRRFLNRWIWDWLFWCQLANRERNII